MELQSRYVGDLTFTIRVGTLIDLTPFDTFQLEVTKPVVGGADGSLETKEWAGAVNGLPSAGVVDFQPTSPGPDVAGRYYCQPVLSHSVTGARLALLPRYMQVIARPPPFVN